MPGLLRGVARTAVIAGTATHVSNNVSRRQQQKWDSQQQAAPEQVAAPQQAAPVDTNDQIAQLEKLAELQKAGILTAEEFTAKKQQILGL
jgi:hypothetical protein